jgi:broad-specificity NMP kinase
MIEGTRPRALPVLWIFGPPGVGKTAVSWRIVTDLGKARTVAYVDIDQLGICYPEPADDPGRHRLKERNLGALVASVSQAGVTCLVVSGVVDPIHGPHPEEIGDINLTLARLRAAPEVLHQRLTTRNGDEPEKFEAAQRYADELDVSQFADLTVDATALAIDEVADRLRHQTGGWPSGADHGTRGDPIVQRSRPVRLPAAGGQVLWLIGATGSGKSTVGWELFQSALGSGASAAFIDLEQIGFVLPVSPDVPRRHRRRASLVASMWAAYWDAGARNLVVVGPGRDAATLNQYRRALATSDLTICRLHAGSEVLAERIRQRGEGAGLPGDTLFDTLPSRLQTIAANASDEAERLEREALGDIRLDTEGRSVNEVVAGVLAALPAWPGGS